MSSKDKKTHQVFQGTLDLIVLRNLATIGPQIQENGLRAVVVLRYLSVSSPTRV